MAEAPDARELNSSRSNDTSKKGVQLRTRPSRPNAHEKSTGASQSPPPDNSAENADSASERGDVKSTSSSSVSQSGGSDKVTEEKVRRGRCGKCEACQVKTDCGECKNCVNKKVLKQSCSKRKCLFLTPIAKKTISRSNSARPRSALRLDAGSISTRIEGSKIALRHPLAEEDGDELAKVNHILFTVSKQDVIPSASTTSQHLKYEGSASVQTTDTSTFGSTSADQRVPAANAAAPKTATAVTLVLPGLHSAASPVAPRKFIARAPGVTSLRTAAATLNPSQQAAAVPIGLSKPAAVAPVSLTKFNAAARVGQLQFSAMGPRQPSNLVTTVRVGQSMLSTTAHSCSSTPTTPAPMRPSKTIIALPVCRAVPTAVAVGVPNMPAVVMPVDRSNSSTDVPAASPVPAAPVHVGPSKPLVTVPIGQSKHPTGSPMKATQPALVAPVDTGRPTAGEPRKSIVLKLDEVTGKCFTSQPLSAPKKHIFVSHVTTPASPAASSPSKGSVFPTCEDAAQEPALPQRIGPSPVAASAIGGDAVGASPSTGMMDWLEQCGTPLAASQDPGSPAPSNESPNVVVPDISALTEAGVDDQAWADVVFDYLDEQNETPVYQEPESPPCSAGSSRFRLCDKDPDSRAPIYFLDENGEAHGSRLVTINYDHLHQV